MMMQNLRTAGPMNHRERTRLLFAPYTPPALKRGGPILLPGGDCDVVITGWTDAPISWPRCRALDTHGGGSGVLVDEQLARAIRNESAVAIGYWWGVGVKTLAWWRKTLGVGRADPIGSWRLIQAAAEAGA